MRTSTLQYLNGIFESLGIPYAYMEWADEPPETFFVGEPIESPSETLEENGFQKTTLILRGYTSGNWMALQNFAETIQRNISRTAVLEDGTGVAIQYSHTLNVPTGVAGWKSNKINIDIQEWKVN